MALTQSAQRAYTEARRRRITGQRSASWRGSEFDVEVWLMAFDVATDENISPWDALMLAVRRRAARVRSVDSVIEAIMAQHVANGGNPDIPPDEIRPWLAESRNEDRLMVRSAKMAVDAGVAEAVVRRLELEGRIATNALVAALDALDLSPDQRLHALSIMHKQLAQLPDKGEGDVAGFIEGT